MTRQIFFLTLVAILGSADAASADPLPERLIVATWNVEWLFDNYAGDTYSDLARSQAAPSREDWDWKLAGVAGVIAKIRPTILALQEVENRRVLFYLTRKLKQEHGLDYKIAYIEGEDYFTEQDVAVLALSGLVESSYKRQTSEMLASKQFYNITKHILCDFEWDRGQDKVELVLLNVHFRAGSEADAIRVRQSKLARHWIDEAVLAGRNVIVLGDVNTNEFHEKITATGDLATLRGLTTKTTADDLTDLFAHFSGQPKETHLIHKQLDHILVTPSLLQKPPRSRLSFRSIDIRRDLVIRGAQQDENHMDVFWTIPAAERDISDHYPVVAEFVAE